MNAETKNAETKNGETKNAETKKETGEKKIFNEKFPCGQCFHTGRWGWRQVNGGLNLKQCYFRSKAAAARDRNKNLMLEDGKIVVCEDW